MQTATVQIESAIYLPGAEGGEESKHMHSHATDFMPRLRGKAPSSAPPAPAETESRFRNEVKSVASFSAPEPEGFFQENWLFVFPLAMLVLLTAFAAILALT